MPHGFDLLCVIGVSVGNLVWGIPLDAKQDFLGDVLTVVHPYALLVGVTAVALMVLPGVVGLAVVLVTFNILREVNRGREGRAFACSCLSIVTMMLLLAATIFPDLVISRPELANGLNIYNGAATDKSLRFMFWVAMIGAPIVLAYTVSIYCVFRGKVTLTEEPY